MRSGAAVLVGVVAAMLATTPAHADLTIVEKFEYYDVTGKTALEIRASINRLGPTSKLDGRRYDALEKANVRWRYTYANTRTGCRIATVSVQAEITVTLPRLARARGTPASVVSAFEKYAEKLLAHEKGHVQIERDVARRIEDGIRKLPPQRTCDQLGRTANALGNSLIREGLRLNAEYDARTRHGRAQGVRFP